MTPKRTDANQAEIVAALRKAGRWVQDIHEVGRGCPDLIVATTTGRMVLLEVKAPGGKLNEREREWHDAWPACCVAIVRSIEEALEVTE